MKTRLLLLFLLASAPAFAQQVNREIKITKRYLNLPVEGKAEKQKMTFDVNGQEVRSFNIRLSQGRPDYWVFADVSAYKGKTLTISFPKNADGLDKLYQSNQIAGADSLYKERYRPQFHFTSRRGWNNDPNGLVYYKGEYHLFYQHNPFEINWDNMTWGHAISKDLLHWKELPDALYPDSLGTMFSGSAAVDLDNTSGFQTGKEKVLVAAYTASGRGIQVQCIAYSNDKGRTWTKYAGNPVINSKAKWNSSSTRDPKIFWYAPGKKWVLVLFEKDGNSIYNSTNLKEWTYQSHIPGFSECPELFQLPVDNDPGNKRWVMCGASGAYLIGDFDGQTFKPESKMLTYFSGKMYAAQTYNNIPASDGRRIQIGWGPITQPGMPFNQMMTFPTQLTLRTTPDGIRMFSEPIAEINSLHKKAYKWSATTAGELSKKLSDVKGDLLLHIRMESGSEAASSLLLDGNAIIDIATVKSLYKTLFGQNAPGNQQLALEILIDRTSVEIFAGKGRFSFIQERKLPKDNHQGLSFAGDPGQEISRMEIYELKSVW